MNLIYSAAVGFLFFIFVSSSSASLACRDLFFMDQSSTPSLESLAKATLASNRNHFDNLFSQTGFKDYESYLAALSSKKINFNADLVDMILHSEAEYSLRAPSAVRNQIAVDGFKNFHETKTSRGFAFSEERLKTEAQGLGMKLRDYIRINHRFKPKYGYLRPGHQLSHLEDVVYGNEARYGGDIYVFNKRAVLVTWTLGDSLGRLNRSDWTRAYIPAEYLGLSVPFLETGLQRRERFEPGPVKTALMPELQHQDFMSGSYIELQFWGQLSLEHVEKFIFTHKPPSGAFLKALLHYNIAIFDGRENPETGVSRLQPWSSKKNF